MRCIRVPRPRSRIRHDDRTTPQLMPLAATARRFGVSANWLRREAEQGRLPHVRADRTMLFAVEVVHRILLERASEALNGVHKK